MPKLKCGLEVHQQLETGKLFCRCPSFLRDDKPEFAVERKLRAVASELGEYDAAALEAMQKNYSFVYEGFKENTCLVELDESPPQKIDSEALKTVLKIALLANSKILDEIFIMRKAVVDGSNTSGFQRTALVSIGGELRISENKKIGIQTICLEEDAARPSKKDEEGRKIYYRLDRLGIPLIELATAPEITSPKEAKEVALAIGRLFRITCKAMRGLGTIRQDLNISIEGGARVEIKGCQDLELIEEIVKREMQRQERLLEAKSEMLKRKLTENDFSQMQTQEISELFKNSAGKLVKGKKIYGAMIPKLKGLLGMELQPERRLGSELSDQVKAKAGLKGLLHSDELPAFGITEQEKKAVAESLEVKENDAFIMVIGEEENAKKAFKAVSERLKQALQGVPEETRNALENGNSEYSRPLPGGARMYPETDLESIKVEKKALEKLRKELPLWPEERLRLYTQEFKLSKQLAEKMVLDNYACFFEELVGKGFDATQTAVLLLEGLTKISREGSETERLTEQHIKEALQLLKQKKLTKETVLEFLKLRSKNLTIPAASLMEKLGTTIFSETELRKTITQIVQKNSALIKEKGERAFAALMGEAMKELKGKADGSTVSKILRQEIGKAK
ncbi:MAG TPA: Glu-tRNA(Gln) amidotransferase subunit GatE [Candidatus Diapherotrites archaeon]|uniref:Glutamyl-tRNA(Gln) amidotransferase subunit E n=1 Tax=Candidatus Iainarchaeum sp. TaxID=3101447 RepID=A0A7J4JVG9_9ARCH|nr:Glu-tRNA(Gln) amidotransferase subunit GatE [Candidatus Diapherotrites archaeon]